VSRAVILSIIVIFNLCLPLQRMEAFIGVSTASGVSGSAIAFALGSSPPCFVFAVRGRTVIQT